MIPTSLSITGFLSYSNKTEIDFSGLDLACISGANGSGKSSILDAFTWSLFGQARNRGDALINSSCDTAKVQLDFSYENDMYRIIRTKQRDKTGLLELHILNPQDDTWKSLTEHTLRATEAKIQDILKMDYDIFVNSAFFLQGKADQFTQQRSGDRKRILSGILGLEVWETYRKKVVTQRKSNEVEINKGEGILEDIQSELAEEDERRTSLSLIETELSATKATLKIQTDKVETVREMTAKIDEERKLINLLVDQKRKKDSTLEGLSISFAEQHNKVVHLLRAIDYADKTESDYAKWEKALLEVERFEEIDSQIMKLELPKKDLEHKIITEETALQQKKKALESQRIMSGGYTVKTEENKIALEETLIYIETQERFLEEKPSVVESLDALRLQIADLKAINANILETNIPIRERLEKLQTNGDFDCPLCGQNMTSEDREKMNDVHNGLLPQKKN